MTEETKKPDVLGIPDDYYRFLSAISGTQGNYYARMFYASMVNGTPASQYYLHDLEERSGAKEKGWRIWSTGAGEVDRYAFVLDHDGDAEVRIFSPYREVDAIAWVKSFFPDAPANWDGNLLTMANSESTETT